MYKGGSKPITEYLKIITEVFSKLQLKGEERDKMIKQKVFQNILNIVLKVSK